jgi:MATE family multidrug resistance protein
MSETTLPSGAIHARHVLGLAWPVLISMLSLSAMEMADTLVCGWLGTAELAAVGLASTVSLFVITPARGLLRGLKIAVAQRTGAQDQPAVAALLGEAVRIGLLLGLLVAPLAWSSGWLFQALGASPEVGRLAGEYFAIRALTAPVSMVVFGIECWFQGRGDTRTPMVSTVAGNVVNVILDPILVFGWLGFPAFGVAGAAWATGAAVVVSLGVLAWRAPWQSTGWRLDLRAWRQPMRLGVPMAVQWTLDFSGFLVLLGLLAGAGDVELAAHVLVFRICMLSILPGFAIADATGVLVGQAVGARRPEAARQAWWSGSWLAASLMTSFGALFLVVPELFLAPFGPEAQVAEVAVRLLGIAALWQGADALVLVGFHALAAGGDTRFTMILFVAGSWLVQVPMSLVLVLGLGWGAYGGWVSLTFEILLVAALTFARVRTRGWLEGRLSAPTSLPQAAPAT